jgi:membrane-associated phospholipid phosphatase
MLSVMQGGTLKKIADMVSLSLVIMVCFPFVMYGVTKDVKYLLWGIGMVISEVINASFKMIVGTKIPAFERPPCAENCSLFNNGGPCGGKPGFPSGHVSMTTCFFFFGYLLTRNVFYLYFGIVWIIAMAWSRIERCCHTPLQTIAGFISGVVSTILMYILFFKFGFITVGFLSR